MSAIYADIIATIEGKREIRVLLKADGRTDAVWVERNSLSPVSQRLVDSARLGEELELSMVRDDAERCRFL